MILFNIENVELIPLELRELDAWVNWVYGTKGKGRVTKIPMNPHVRGTPKVMILRRGKLRKGTGERGAGARGVWPHVCLPAASVGLLRA